MQSSEGHESQLPAAWHELNMSLQLTLLASIEFHIEEHRFKHTSLWRVLLGNPLRPNPSYCTREYLVPPPLSHLTATLLHVFMHLDIQALLHGA